jgi:hypothetical protein
MLLMEAVNGSCVMVRTIMYIGHALQAEMLLALYSLCSTVVVLATMMG